MKGFKFVIYILFPFPKLTWRNRCNLPHDGRSELRSVVDTDAGYGNGYYGGWRRRAM